MSSLKNRVGRLENRALNGPGELAPEFTTDNGLHVSATMPRMGLLLRAHDETNVAFEQRVYTAVRETASRGDVGFERLSDDTLVACLAALPASFHALDNPMVRAWFETALAQKEGASE